MLSTNGGVAFCVVNPVRVGGSGVESGRSRAGRCQRGDVVARAKNPGGFRLPPQVPEQRELLSRAYELLGNRTQRRLKPSVETELEDLIGTVPETKQAAQKYKAAIELQMRKDYRVSNGVLLATPLSRTKYMDKITMPEDERDITVSFSILQALRRDGMVSSRTKQRLEQLVGIVPRDAHEAKRVSNALKRLVRERYRRERYPPRLPQTDEELTTAYMLLGAFARQGTVGPRTSDLRTLLGDIPRTRNVAVYWKKFVGMHIRRNKRGALVKSRKLAADLIREQRRKKREARERAEEAAGVLESFTDSRASGTKTRVALLIAIVLVMAVVGGPLSLSSTPRLRVH